MKNKKFVLPIIFASLGLFQFQSPHIYAQVNSAQNLKVTYSAGELFAVRGQDFQIKIDLEGFEETHVGSLSDDLLFTTGHLEKKLLVEARFDTLYTDIEPQAIEYQKLWWDMLYRDTNTVLSKLESWTVGELQWAKYTVDTAYGFAINERHYEVFGIYQNFQFHLSISRPMYLPGDSAMMFEILNSFEIIPAKDPSNESSTESSK